MWPHPQALFSEQQTLRVSTLRDIVSPSFDHTADIPFALVRVCYVEQMSVEETANWVWTLGHGIGWQEVETYAAKFREQCITGKLLQQLNNEMLEFCLGIPNSGHRDYLLSAIRYLFAKPPMVVSDMGSERCAFASSSAYLCGNYFLKQTQPSSSGSGVYGYHNPSSTVVDQPYFRSKSPDNLVPSSSSDRQFKRVNKIPNIFPLDGEQSGYESATTCRTDMADSVQTDFTDVTSLSNYSNRSAVLDNIHDNGQSMHSESLGSSKLEISDRNKDMKSLGITAPPGLEQNLPTRKSNSVCQRRSKPSNIKKLVLTFQPGQIPKEGDVDRIRSWFIEMDAAVEVQPMTWANSYTIVFQDPNVAQKVLVGFRKMGFMIAKKFPPRPSPSCPIYYKTLESLIIRKGKAFSGTILGSLDKGRTVLVNQIKGRRARLIKQKNDTNKGWVTWGWVSLRSSKGKPLITQVAEPC